MVKHNKSGATAVVLTAQDKIDAAVAATGTSKPTVPAPVIKYASREEKFAKTGHVSFKYSTVRLVAGPNMPKNQSSVMGKVRALAFAAGVAGVTGDELVELMRSSEDFRPNRTAYGQGIPCASWCHGYIVGALRPTKGFLKLAKGEVEPVAEPKVAKGKAAAKGKAPAANDEERVAV